MTELSSQAQAVLDAADSAFDQAGTTRQGIAAALRAVANDWRVDTEFIGGVEYIRASTLERIASELEVEA
jgi:hypothetical protein